MSNQEIKLIKTLYERLYDILTFNPDESKTNSIHLQLAKPSIPINPKDFEEQRSPNNKRGSLASTENFSRLFDSIPVPGALYNKTGKSVDKIYGQVINHARIRGQNDLPSQQAYEKATKILNGDGYDRYVLSKLNYDNIIKKYRVLKYKEEEGMDEEELDAELSSLESKIDVAQNELIRSNARKYENALYTKEYSINQPVKSIFHNIRSKYNRSSMKSKISGTNWHIAYPMPSNWLGESDIFTEFFMSSRNLSNESNLSSTSIELEASCSHGFWSVSGSGNYAKNQTSSHMDASEIEISMKFASINIIRPWLDTSIFHMKGWNMGNAYSVGGISQGIDNIKGAMPLIPQSFVIAKDITIKGDWSESDKTHIDKALSAKVKVSIGPFSMSGKYSDSSSKDTFTSKLDKGTIKIPGLHIIGVVSQYVPVCPKE